MIGTSEYYPVSVKNKAWSSKRTDWEVIRTHISGLQVWLSQKRSVRGIINRAILVMMAEGQKLWLEEKGRKGNSGLCNGKVKDGRSFRHGWIKANNGVIGTGLPLCSALTLVSWLHPQVSCVHPVARWKPAHPGLSAFSLASPAVPARVLGLVLSGPYWVTVNHLSLA